MSGRGRGRGWRRDKVPEAALGPSSEHKPALPRLMVAGKELDYNFDREIAYCIQGADTSKSVESFEELGLDRQILENIVNAGMKQPTPIQRHGLPHMLAGMDVMCCSHTGSGKTVAYVLSLIDRIKKDYIKETANMAWQNRGSKKVGTRKSGRTSYPRGLVLVPTRELAEQIQNEVNTFGARVSITGTAVYGGDSIGHELKVLRMGRTDILVATPGRLMHLLTDFDVLSLDLIDYLVIDEADEMFDLGFFPQISEIVKKYLIPKDERVNIMFSATFPLQIQYYAKKHLRADHVFIVIGILGGASPDVSHDIRCVSAYEKRYKLVRLFETELVNDEKTIVFCNKIDTVDSINDYLCHKEKASTKIHSSLAQSERNQALRDFNEGKCSILVATSVAARGLNIPGVNYVVNYDLPRNIDEFVQRVGRTGRIGKVGIAITFFDEDGDEEVATDLVTVLGSVNQPVPAFLAEAGHKMQELMLDEEYQNANEDGQIKMRKCRMPQVWECTEEEDFWG